LFLAFFTGLYITVVLKALNGLGQKLLSPEAQQKVAEKATTILAPEVERPPSQTGADVQPPAGLFEAVNEARKELIDQHQTVIGVGAGEKQTDGMSTGQPAIVVYVAEKQRIPESPVPPVYKGFATDVREIPPPAAGIVCHDVPFDLSWQKVRKLNPSQSGLNGMPADTSVERFPADEPKFLILTAAPDQLLVRASDRVELLDIDSKQRGVSSLQAIC
jgi:hypothetical protein